jgi:hypothetical protein
MSKNLIFLLEKQGVALYSVVYGIYVYTYIYVCVCVCVYLAGSTSVKLCRLSQKLKKKLYSF